uniref:Large ribosomal subunit protein uL23cz/uL23cy n=1 Tax=Allotropa virgata TaxID=176242 RepID=A0A221SQV2_9ERIC|nr:ribosomal protein L23 [Allotropa virgata]ASN78885.1 ribosomal protein L23 [Allotropa virgata]ASN78908.1 ribosomal protein L23 [Allotropa virgata]
MDGIKYAVFTEKGNRLRNKNQYTFNVESGSTRTEIKHWIERFFGVKIIAMNSHRLPGKRRRVGRRIIEHTTNCRRMIITLQPGYSILPLKSSLKEF